MNRKFGDYRKGDERILGDSAFVEEVLNSAQEKLVACREMQHQDLDLDDLVRIAAKLLGLAPKDVWSVGKRSAVVQAKSLVCYWATNELGMTALKSEKGWRYRSRVQVGQSCGANS
ncbi:hypothetical protein [Geomonas limicola]|uniref:hypothetical protein n=1 Tax=Geomonas limicola TaxID=2740186 RepID=UPI001613D181|nr:hypothetical protein [Geomonas limicola]